MSHIYTVGRVEESRSDVYDGNGQGGPNKKTAKAQRLAIKCFMLCLKSPIYTVQFYFTLHSLE